MHLLSQGPVLINHFSSHADLYLSHSSMLLLAIQLRSNMSKIFRMQFQSFHGKTFYCLTFKSSVHAWALRCTLWLIILGTI